MKRCYKCSELKNFDEFYNSKSRSDGKQSACKKCRKKMCQEYFSREYVKDKRRLDQKNWVLKNPDLANLTYKKWRNSNLEISRQIAKNWKSRNPILTMGYSRKRAVSEKIATPSWSNKLEISKKYRIAKRLTDLTGIKHSVDHFYPITSHFVCGLHCEMNMRVIALDDNEKKHNKIVEFDTKGNIYVSKSNHH